jgi:hypothetical protein
MRAHVGTFAMLDQDQADHAQRRKHLQGEHQGQHDIHQNSSICISIRQIQAAAAAMIVRKSGA